MLAPIFASIDVLQQYRKHPSSGPRELTPTMVGSIEEADKPAKRGKKPETHKEAQVCKPTKGKTAKKRKYDKAVTSPPQPKKLKKPARRLILQSSSDSDSEYVPPQHKNAPPSESESESSDDEASGRGDTPPRSPTLEIPVHSHPPSPPPVTIPAAAKKNAQTVNASMDNLQRSLQSERSNLKATCQAIEAANASLHANVNDRLTQLEAELAVENRIMDELDRRTSQLKMQNYKLRTASAELNDLKLEKEGNEASVSNKGKKKKKIREDDTDDEDEIYAENPKNPFQKVNLSEKELEEKLKKQQAELEKKRKETELLEKKNSMFLVSTIVFLQRCAIDEQSIL
ncbi:unnamed protein product [Lactuca saligna]|uniref:Uncharacterized protein n=1 Tax=Lactuca saligna TaxID=75948 RepID=A0AA36E5Z3_LACSI|nr:unnamed protein product [Lactuca saligna]